MTKQWMRPLTYAARNGEIDKYFAPAKCRKCKKNANGYWLPSRDIAIPYCHDCAAVLDVDLE